MEKDFDQTKFIFKELYTNEDGKTSGSGFTGVIAGLTGLFGFLMAYLGWFLNIPQAFEFGELSLEMIGWAALLMGVRKGVSGFIKNKRSKG